MWRFTSDIGVSSNSRVAVRLKLHSKLLDCRPITPVDDERVEYLIHRFIHSFKTPTKKKQINKSTAVVRVGAITRTTTVDPQQIIGKQWARNGNELAMTIWPQHPANRSRDPPGPSTVFFFLAGLFFFQQSRLMKLPARDPSRILSADSRRGSRTPQC